MSKKNKEMKSEAIKGILENAKNETDIKDYDELAELILKTIAEENKKDEEEAKAKKDKKEDKKPESKKDKKEDKKPESKKDKKEDKKEDKKPESKKDKKDNDWLKAEPSLSDKIIKITSPMWFEKIIIQGEEHNYQLRHKLTKNEHIRVRIQNDNNDFIVKVIKEKNSGEIDFTIKKIVNIKGVEHEEKYEHDYIKEYGHKIPFMVIIMPLVDFYYGLHDFNKCTEGNTKIYNNSIIIDANIRKDGYILEPKDLSVEELEELKKDKDNVIGVEIEYFRRAEETDDQNEEKEVKNEVVTEDKKEKADEKVIAVLEEIDKELKYKIVSHKTPVEDRFYIIREQMLKDNKVYDKIAAILKDEKTNIKELCLLGITEKNIADLLAPKTANEKISDCLKENKKPIMESIKRCTNIGERSVFFVHKVLELTKVEEVDMRTFLSLNREWIYFVFEQMDKDVTEYQRNLLLQHMLQCAFK